MPLYTTVVSQGVDIVLFTEGRLVNDAVLRQAGQELEKVILAMASAGTKIVLVTHNLGQARRLGDEILFLHQGKLAERASAELFFKHPQSVEARQFLEGVLPW